MQSRIRVYESGRSEQVVVNLTAKRWLAFFTCLLCFFGFGGKVEFVSI